MYTILENRCVCIFFNRLQKWRRLSIRVKILNYLFIYSFLCMFSENFLPREPISMIIFLFGRGYLRSGHILIWSSSEDWINDKIKEISNSYEQIIEIIINKIFDKIKKKTILKRSFKITIVSREFLYL